MEITFLMVDTVPLRRIQPDDDRVICKLNYKIVTTRNDLNFSAQEMGCRKENKE